jgi:hypothetical protein
MKEERDIVIIDLFKPQHVIHHAKVMWIKPIYLAAISM